MCGYCGCGQTDSKKNNYHHHHHHDERIIQIEQDILAENIRFADQNRKRLSTQKIAAFNLVSSPGSGKTTLLTQTITALKDKLSISVIEGDQQTDRDAKRIAETGASVLQVNTGKACHLDAHRIGHALDDLSPKDHSVLFIENVGNLVCPALFDLGENCKVVILSVTEGDDKPLKYPHMFDQAKLMIINKIDLLPYVDFNVEDCITYAQQINPNIQVLQTSAITGEGLDSWCQWIIEKHATFAH
jgi:hydrogenase nickel incorporation protein HypB